MWPGSYVVQNVPSAAARTTGSPQLMLESRSFGLLGITFGRWTTFHVRPPSNDVKTRVLKKSCQLSPAGMDEIVVPRGSLDGMGAHAGFIGDWQALVNWLPI